MLALIFGVILCCFAWYLIRAGIMFVMYGIYQILNKINGNE